MDSTKHRLLGLDVVAFAVGCVAGALSVARVGFGALVVPAAAALVARSRIQ